MVRYQKNNSIVGSPMYPTIMARYNEILKRDGKVNETKFYRENIGGIVDIKYGAWRKFISRFRSVAGMPQHSAVVPNPSAPSGPVIEAEVQNTVIRNLVDSPIAIQRGIATALNIGMESLQKILSGDSTLSERDKTELLFKAMKAQDSRINAIARMKKDVREEKLFNSVFDDAVYADDSLET